MALLAAVSIVCAQSTVSDVFAAGAEEVGSTGKQCSFNRIPYFTTR